MQHSLFFFECNKHKTSPFRATAENCNTFNRRLYVNSCFSTNCELNLILSVSLLAERCSLNSYHAVMHDFIPIFSCDDTEENGDSFACCGEVGMPVRFRDTDKKQLSDNTSSLYLQFTACYSAEIKLIKEVREMQTLPVYVLSIFNGSEENNSSKSVAEEEEKHAHNDEEALVHAHYYGQQQHLERHLHRQ